MRAGMPAGREIMLGDWVVRVSGGPTKRVNSANAAAAGAQVAPVLSAVERIYRAAGLPPRFRLTPLVDPASDAALAREGYEVRDESWTMVAPAAAQNSDDAVRVGVFEPAWLDALAEGSGWDAVARAAHGERLARLPQPCAAFTLIDDGAPIAFAAGSVAGGAVHVFDVLTLERARGRGAARRIVRAMLGWAAAQGASSAVLQVLADNAPARRAYAALGFADAYRYHYRVSR